MLARKILAALFAVILGVLLIAALVPLAAGFPSWMPAGLGRIALRLGQSLDEYHGWVTAELAGAAVVALCTALYFRLTAEPPVIRLKHRGKKRTSG
jgi:hypothetical protein